jgi:ATP-dependent DNA helicase RecQ
MQLKAGYIVDSIAKVVSDFKAKLDKHKPADQTQLDQINGLLQHVSSFDVDFPFKHSPDFKKLHPVLATLNNIITRGLPTRAPILLENLFSEIGLTVQTKDVFEIDFSISANPISYSNIFELLHIIEPKLKIDRENYGGKLGSEGEWKFLNTDLKEFPFAKQILQSQRDFVTINRNLGGGKSLDFSYEFPYLNSQNSYLKMKGVIFEYDGSHHKINSYKYYDAYRDDAADENNFETLRQPSDKVELDQSIIDQFKKDIFKILKKNFEKDIIGHLAEYSILFIPLAVARVQKTILELLLVHSELFTNEKIEIAIIERDLPCGAIAIKSLQDLFFNINAILDDKDKLILPEISLTIFENSKWVIDSKLHLEACVKDESFFKQNKFDIILDHSILRRSNIYKETDFQNDRSVKIRSSHFFDTAFGKAKRVYCAKLLQYKPLVRKKNDGSYEPIKKYEDSINFFIQNIFRKLSFWEGQLPIISRAIQQKPVIGLLPTGGGKSLTFQLPTFLQPGLCLVVDPIKSLMEDQVRVLKQNWIDCCDFINSNLKRKEKVKKLIDFRYGETMFLFVSPERFVMQDFRNIIRTIDVSKFGLAFSYCVIDEVHCVSEWGHDFRSTYLMLGKNSQRFAKTKSEKAVSLIGLTATASFDVLADIERELQIQHDDVADAIIMIENTIRPELFFRVTDVTDKDRMNALNNDFGKFGKNLEKINNEEILKKSQQHHFNEFEKRDFATLETRKSIDESKIKFEYNDKYLIKESLKDKSQNDFYSIIFCPTKGNKRNSAGEITDTRGVPFVFENLNSNSKGFFHASDEDEISQEIQDHFENFVTDKSKHIVCTKAFGMGIDKKDIRSTYHYYYSGSLESLVQEAGRSGRDKKISEANILISKSKYVKLDVYKFFSENQSFKLIQNKYTRKAIRQAFEKKWKDNLPIDILFSTFG